MQSKERVKVIFKDGENTKAITGIILKEDDYFLFIHAELTNKEIRIGKGAIVLVKPVGDD